MSNGATENAGQEIAGLENDGQQLQVVGSDRHTDEG